MSMNEFLGWLAAVVLAGVLLVNMMPRKAAPSPSPDPGSGTEPPPAPAPAPHEFNPQADFEQPALWKYIPDKSYPIWIPKNYKNYIQAASALVQYFIDHIKLVEDRGMLLVVFKSNNKRVEFRYRKDDARLCTEAGQYDSECYGGLDFWQNPDYYIWNMFEGDCEDYALFMASVFERMGIPYAIVSGYGEGTADWWVEFWYNKKKFIGQVNLHQGMPEDLHDVNRKTYKPLQMFSRKLDIQSYNPNWRDMT